MVYSSKRESNCSSDVSYPSFAFLFSLLLSFEMGVREVRELVKIEEARVNSVAEEGWCWTVHENSSKMTITATTQTSLVKGIIPLMLCSDLINFIKNYLFVFSCDNSIDRSPESGIP